MKLLSQLLSQNVAAYEEKFGEMAVATDRAAEAHRIGFDTVPPTSKPKMP
jgi:hypothetical protein